MWLQAQELLAEVLKGHVEAAVAAGTPAPTEQEYEEYEEYEESATPRGATPEAALEATPGAMPGAVAGATPETMPGAAPATPSSGGTIQLGEGGARSSSLPRVPRAAAAAAAVAAMQHAAAAVGSGRRGSSVEAYTMYEKGEGEGEQEGEQEGGNGSDEGDGSDGGGDGGDGGDAAARTPSSSTLDFHGSQALAPLPHARPHPRPHPHPRTLRTFALVPACMPLPSAPRSPCDLLTIVPLSPRSPCRLRATLRELLPRAVTCPPFLRPPLLGPPLLAAPLDPLGQSPAVRRGLHRGGRSAGGGRGASNAGT